MLSGMDRMPLPPESFFEGTPHHIRTDIEQLHATIADLHTRIAECDWLATVAEESVTRNVHRPGRQAPARYLNAALPDVQIVEALALSIGVDALMEFRRTAGLLRPGVGVAPKSALGFALSLSQADALPPFPSPEQLAGRQHRSASNSSVESTTLTF